MQLFYSSKIENDRLFLNEEETRHAASVLRKTIGDNLVVMDGKGNEYHAEIVRIAKKETELLIRHTHNHEKPKNELHLVVAPTKNIDRIEWLLEKGIEVGLSSLSFIRCDRSERKLVNRERLDKIALAACKQSLTWHFPVLNEIESFSVFLKQTTVEKGFIAVCNDAELVLNSATDLGKSVHFMVGPEGDFTPAEYGAAKKAGWTGISLGEKRLRTETAALVGVVGINLLWSS